MSNPTLSPCLGQLVAGISRPNENYDICILAAGTLKVTIPLADFSRRFACKVTTLYFAHAKSIQTTLLAP